MRNRLWAIGLIAMVAVSACGDDDDGTTSPGDAITVPAESLTRQDALDVDVVLARAETDPDLAAILAGMATPSSAGVVEDTSGRVLYWAEATPPDGLPVTAVHSCSPDGDCIARKHVRTSSGLSWTDAQGAAASPVTMGRPGLLRDLEMHSLSNPTHLSTREGALDLDPANLPTVDFAHRRLVLLNTFGDALGVSLGPVRDVAVSHGGFHEVEEVTYAREADVIRELESMDGLDALIWLSQGVREEVKSGWQQSRTVGLTVNRGGFGETIFSRDDLSAAGDFNVSAGPGLIFLAASHSHSDGSEGQPDAGSIWGRLDDGDRVIVGLSGAADVKEVLEASVAFFDLFLGGTATLEEALAAGTDALGTEASLVSNIYDPSTVTWLETYESVWDDVGFSPSNVQAVIPITATPYCGPPGGTKTAGDEGHTQPFADVTFETAYFEGHRVTELTGLSVDVTIRGVVTGFQEKDRVLLEVFGNFDDNYRDYHAFGEGTIQEVEIDDDGTYTVHFNGAAHTSPFSNADGEECVLNNPQISTTTSVQAKLVMKP